MEIACCPLGAGQLIDRPIADFRDRKTASEQFLKIDPLT